jgi:type I restriction enzyme, S subunit
MKLTVDSGQFTKQWLTRKLGEICSISTGKLNANAAVENGEYPFFTCSRDIFYIDVFAFDCEAILLAGNNAVGDFNVKHYNGKFNAYQRTYVITINKGESLLYKYLYLQMETALKDFKIKSVGAGTKFLKIDMIKDLAIHLPPLHEQKRIVAIVDEAFESIDIAIENTKKNLTNTRELFENYRNSIFIQRNDGWEKKKLGDIATFRNGLNYTKDSKGKSIKIVGVKDFKNEFWVDETTLESVTIDEDLKEIDILRAGDILTVRSNGNKELIGRCIMAHELQEEMSHSGFTIRIRMERKDIHPPFIVHFLKSRELRKQLIESGGGINISSLNQQGLSLIMMSFPVLEKQKNIVKNIDNLAVETQRLEAIYQKKLAALTELKQSILQKAFTGELTADTTNQTTKKSKEVIAA